MLSQLEGNHMNKWYAAYLFFCYPQNCMQHALKRYWCFQASVGMNFQGTETSFRVHSFLKLSVESFMSNYKRG